MSPVSSSGGVWLAEESIVGGVTVSEPEPHPKTHRARKNAGSQRTIIFELTKKEDLKIMENLHFQRIKRHRFIVQLAVVTKRRRAPPILWEIALLLCDVTSRDS